MAHARTSSPRSESPAATSAGKRNRSQHDEPGTVAALQAELRRLRHELARAQKLATLGTLAGGICHEVNNILTPVMSYAEMAIDAPGDAALTRKALERAYHGADRASRVASAILSFAADRPRAASPGAAGVAAVVAETWACLAADPVRQGVQVVTSIEPGCSAVIDPVELQQVILNLVLNALKAMRTSGGRLSIRGWSRPSQAEDRSTWNSGDAASGEVVIEVEDTGCGIEPERQALVFEPFVGHRWTNAPKDGSAGTGLGLTVCKHIVESAGGSIAVRSQVSVGTCFTIVLPAVRSTINLAEPAAARR
ncbi:MAG: sensor histidine kinase [Phycisphaerales bacterium]